MTTILSFLVYDQNRNLVNNFRESHEEYGDIVTYGKPKLHLLVLSNSCLQDHHSLASLPGTIILLALQVPAIQVVHVEVVSVVWWHRKCLPNKQLKYQVQVAVSQCIVYAYDIICKRLELHCYTDTMYQTCLSSGRTT